MHISYFVYSIVQLCIFHILWKALCNCAYSIFCVQHCAIVHIPVAESQRRNYTSKEPFVRSTQQYDATDTEGQSIAIYVILIIEWVLCKIGYLVVERTNHNMTNSELVNEWYFKGDMTFPGEMNELFVPLIQPFPQNRSTQSLLVSTGGLVAGWSLVSGPIWPVSLWALLINLRTIQFQEH